MRATAYILLTVLLLYTRKVHFIPELEIKTQPICNKQNHHIEEVFTPQQEEEKHGRRGKRTFLKYYLDETLRNE